MHKNTSQAVPESDEDSACVLTPSPSTSKGRTRENHVHLVAHPEQNSVAMNIVKPMLAKYTLIKTVTMVVFIIIFSMISLSAPIYEWDILPYIANATTIVTGLPVEALHGPIYENLKESIPPEKYAALLGSPSRLVLSQDPEAFRQTTAFFYDARIVHTYILAGLIKWGFNPVHAMYVYTTSCSVLSVLLLSRIIPARAPLGLYFVLPFIALSCGLLTVARFATPDSLATLTTITLYFALFRNRAVLLLFLLPLTVFIRTDLIVLTGFFFAYFFLTNRCSRVAIVASALATATAYLALNNMIVEGDPWSSLIGYNFGEKPTHPQDYVFPVNVSDYVSYILLGLKSFSYEPIFFVFCMLTVTGLVQFSSHFFFTNNNRPPVSQQHADVLFLLISCIGYLGLHFLMFPVTWTRFFAAQYSLVAVVVVWATLAILAERNYSIRESMDLFK